MLSRDRAENFKEESISLIPASRSLAVQSLVAIRDNGTFSGDSFVYDKATFRSTIHIDEHKRGTRIIRYREKDTNR